MIQAPVFNLIKWFLLRNVFNSISSKDFVLDVGGGDKPFWRANVILDKYIESNSKSQRFTGMQSTYLTNQILIEGDAEKMPFIDSAFDFINCTHLLEHVINPEKVIKELMRVGKRGYIETPTSWKQKIIDMSSHLWFVRLKDNKLYFKAKETVQYHDDDYEVMRNIFQKYNFIIDRTNFMTSLYWKAKILYQIDGKPSIKLIEQAESEAEFEQSKKLLFFIYKLLNILFSYLFFWKKYHGQKTLMGVLQCPKCNNQKFSKASSTTFTCENCNYLINFIS